jgi:hypothetical protein
MVPHLLFAPFLRLFAAISEVRLFSASRCLGGEIPKIGFGG